MFGLFKKKAPEDSHEPLVVVPIPALVVVLVQKEREKGAPLSREEVERIRDATVCMTIRQSHAKKMEEQRGYPDINPERCWEDWSARRETVLHKSGDA
jgi:hypothetical protein